jgi:arsenate reductase
MLLKHEHFSARQLLAEFLGSAMLAGIVVGSGIMAETLSPTDVGLQLLENAAATAAGLYALILIFGAVSGAHFNPIVSFVDVVRGGASWQRALSYLPVQVAGCSVGAISANAMFGQHLVTISTHHRVTSAHLFSEVLATAGLVLVIFALSHNGHGSAIPAAVGCYIGAAYFATSSTSFANPAIAVGRMLSNTFAGIAPASVPAFIAAEIVGGVMGLLLVNALYPTSKEKDIQP